MGLGGFVAAWLVGEGIIVYRSVRAKRPPMPAALAASSGLFVILALLAEAAPTLAAMLAWGFDLAAFMDLFSRNPPKILGTLIPQASGGGNTAPGGGGAPAQKTPGASTGGGTVVTI